MPFAFSISTDVFSSRFDRKTSVFAMFRERPVSMSRSTKVSSRRLRRTSLLVEFPRHLLIWQYIFLPLAEGSYDMNRCRSVRGTVSAFRLLVEDRDARQGLHEPRSPSIA